MPGASDLPQKTETGLRLLINGKASQRSRDETHSGINISRLDVTEMVVETVSIRVAELQTLR